MLRKMLIFGLPILILLGSAATVIALERQRTPDWQRAFDRYVAQERSVNVQVELLGVENAMLPWNFGAQMGTPVIPAFDWAWQIDRLPYPPDSLRCAMIRRTPTEAQSPTSIESKRQLLYIAHHSDAVWRTGWVVHEGPITPFAPVVAEQLATVGCGGLPNAPE